MSGGGALEAPAATRRRILVAEDDPDVGRYVEVSLSVEGYEIHRASDGVAAVAKAIEIQPDLVLLDIGMPGMDGVAVCQELRRDPRTSVVPIIMLTARVQQSDKVDGLDAGADDYITKPFDPVELAARINAALRKTRQLPRRVAAHRAARQHRDLPPARTAAGRGARLRAGPRRPRQLQGLQRPVRLRRGRRRHPRRRRRADRRVSRPIRECPASPATSAATTSSW